MARGIAALCIEQRSFGERRERHQGRVSTHGCHDATMHALMLGRTLLGERVFDVDRGLDYLETRDDVDWSRVGIMGNSGGGTVSLFSAAVAAAGSGTRCPSSLLLHVPRFHHVHLPLRRQLRAGAAPTRGDGRRDGACSHRAPWCSSRESTTRFSPSLLPGALLPTSSRSTLRRGPVIAATWSSVPEGHRFYADAAWPVMLQELQRAG